MTLKCLVTHTPCLTRVADGEECDCYNCRMFATMQRTESAEVQLEEETLP